MKRLLLLLLWVTYSSSPSRASTSCAVARANLGTFDDTKDRALLDAVDRDCFKNILSDLAHGKLNSKVQFTSLADQIVQRKTSDLIHDYAEILNLGERVKDETFGIGLARLFYFFPNETIKAISVLHEHHALLIQRLGFGLKYLALGNPALVPEIENRLKAEGPLPLVDEIHKSWKSKK